MVHEVGYAAQDMKVRNFGSWERVRGLKGWMEEQQKIDWMVGGLMIWTWEGGVLDILVLEKK
jgi:hypothetical protein